MMKPAKLVVAAFAVGILLAALSGCEKGPAEKAGESIDNAVGKTGRQIDKAGDKIKDAANDTKK